MNEQQYLIATQRAIDELARRCTEALAPAEYVQSIHDIGAAILALLAGDDGGAILHALGDDEPTDEEWYTELEAGYRAGMRR